MASTCWSEFEPRHWHYSDASPNNVEPEPRMFSVLFSRCGLLNEMLFIEFVQNKTIPPNVMQRPGIFFTYRETVLGIFSKPPK